MFKQFILLFFMTFQAMTSAIAQTTLQPIHSIEGINEYRLANGLQVLLIPDSSRPSITVNMTYHVGARHEAYARTGMAHLLEHLVFRGTARFPDILQQFSQKGLQANGSTNTDRTNYYATFHADKETLDWYLQWQADVMQHLEINEKNLRTEIDIVLNERERGQSNPMQVLFERIKSAAYHWNNIGTAVIGAPDDLKNMQAKDLLAFYQYYYQPDNATLIIAGDFDEKALIEQVNAIFAAIPKPQRALQALQTQEPTQDGERLIILRQQGNMPFIANAYHIPDSANPDYVALEIAVDMLSDRPSGLLYRKLVQDNKLASNTFGTSHVNVGGGLAILGAQLSDINHLKQAQETLNNLVEQLSSNPFTEEELQRARTYWLNQWQKLYANTEHLALGLSEAVAAGDWRLFFLERDYIKALTLAQVQKAAEQYFVPTNRTAGQYIPTENVVQAPLIQASNLEEVFKNYQGQSQSVATQAFDTSADNIQASTQTGVLQLANGKVNYALLSKPSRGERVFANYRVKFSDLATLSKQATLSGFAASLITSGSQHYSQQEIQDKIDALNGSLSYHISANQLVVTLSTTKEYLADLLDFSFELIQEANYPKPELDNFTAQVKRALQASQNEPAAKASQALNRYLSHFSADDFRYIPTTEEQLASIEKINRQQLIDFNRRHFGAGDIDIAIVGTFDTKQALQHIEKSLSQWRKADTYVYIPDPYDDFASKTFVLETPGKANAIFLGKLLLPLQNTAPDYPALVVANYLLGGSESSRLFKAVRAEQGLSYSIHSGVNASSFEPSAEWTIQAIYSPDNREKVADTIAKTIADIKDKGFTQEELEHGIEAIIKLRALSRSQDNTLSAAWLRYLESGRDFTWHAQMEEKFKQLRLEDINQAARKYLDFDKMSKAFAGDFNPKRVVH